MHVVMSWMQLLAESISSFSERFEEENIQKIQSFGQELKGLPYNKMNLKWQYSRFSYNKVAWDNCQIHVILNI